MGDPPPPWTVKELDACFVVIEAQRRILAQTNNLLAEIIKPRQIIPNISTSASGARVL